MDDYEESDDKGTSKDSNANNKDDSAHVGQTKENSVKNREHKRKRHGKSRHRR